MESAAKDRILSQIGEGILKKFLPKSMAIGFIFGALLVMKALFWIVSSPRAAIAALSLKKLGKLRSNYGSPNEIVTDKLGSYHAPLREIGYSDHH